MASSDQLVMSDVKIEVDKDEEPELSWGSQRYLSGTKSDWYEKSMNSTITPCETDCRNRSAAAMMSEPDSQSSSGHGIKTNLVDCTTVDTFQAAKQFAIALGIKAEPVDDNVTGDTFQPASQPATVLGIKAEPVDDSVTGDTVQSTSQPAILPGISAEPGDHSVTGDTFQPTSQFAIVLGIKAEPVDYSLTGDAFHQFQSAGKKEGKVDIKSEFCISPDSSSPLDPWSVVKSEDSEPADIWESSLKVKFEWQTGLSGVNMITSGISSNIKTNRSELVTADIRYDDVENEQAVTTCISEAISSGDEEENRPEGLKQNEGSCVRTTPQPSATDRSPVHTSASTSGSLLPRNTSHLWQHCSDWSTPEGCDAGYCGNIDSENGILAGRKSDGKKNDRTDDNQTEKTCMEKDRPHVCDVCSKAFTYASDLKRHKLIHAGLKQFVCDVCSKAFIRAGHLKSHKLIHTGVKQFVCDVCNKAFTQAFNLKKHKLIHTGLKQFVCDVCNKAFTQAVNLKKHKLIHAGLRQFVCDVCNKDFTEAGSLKRHKWIHTGLKQFVCDVCNKAFTESGHLKVHKLTHIGLKQFLCDVCNKAFTEPGSLKKHKLTHTGLKQYVCDVCTKAFAQAGNLKKHKLIHTGQKQCV